MNNKWIIPLLLLSILPFSPSVVQAEERRAPVKLEGKNVLPLRVLAKSFSNIYQDKSEGSTIVKENLPAFQPFYVYTRPTPEDLELEAGWYEIGSDNRGTIVGWMKQDDVFEWQQTLCLAYTHPLGRKPVLMFDSMGYARDLALKPKEERIATLTDLFNKIDSGNIDSSFPVKSVEPKRAVDITQEFYLLPILNYETIEIDNREGRLVQLAAVTSAVPDARVKSDIRDNTEYREQAAANVATVDRDVAQNINIDVVWVIDTTVSMRPFIEKTLEVVQQVSGAIGSDQQVKDAVRFGIWGYRDSAEDIKGIEYTTFNYTPELQDIDTFIGQLAKVKVTEVDSADYAEDMFSGVADAISKTNWRPDAIRFIVLVGDAPSHQAGHKWNLSGQEENSLRSLASDRKVFISALHLKNPKATKFHELAETQLRALGTNPGASQATYMDAVSTDVEEFGRLSTSLSSTLSGTIMEIIKQSGQSGDGAAPAQAQNEPAAQALAELAPSDPTESTAPVPADPTAQAASEPAGQAPAVTETATLAQNITDQGTTTSPAPPQGELAELEEPKPAAQGGEMAALEGNSTAGEQQPAQVDAAPQAAETTAPPQPAPDANITLNLDEITAANSQGNELAAQMVKAAIVQWIGSKTEAQAPRDIVAWAVDKDFEEPAIQAMEVRLLINKQQLDSLYGVLKSVLDAGQQGQIGGGDFFDALQATAAITARDPELIKKAKTMAGTGLIPEFLEGLPYRSQLMDMNNELWASWSVDDQDEFLNDLEANMETYKTIHDSPEGWIQLNPSDESDEYVYPLALDMLP